MLLPQLHGIFLERHSCHTLLVVEVACEGSAACENRLLIAVETVVLDD